MPDDPKKLQVSIEATSNLPQVAATDKKAVEDLTKATGDTTGKTKEETKATGELDIKKRELLESIRAMTREFPILGEVARSVFNPTAFGIFGLVSAVEILNSRLDNLSKALGGIELPDLGAGLQAAGELAEKYNGLETAVSNAQATFDSAASTFDRQKTAIQDQLEAMRQLITATKEKAIADLDIERASGKLSPGLYAARKSMIELGANDQTVQAEIDARNADLAAKQEEAQRANFEAFQARAKAQSFKLPESDEEVNGQIKAQEDRAADLRKQAEEARTEAKKQQEIQANQSGGIRERFSAAVGQLTNAFRFGGWSTPEEIEKMFTGAARDKEEQAGAADLAAARIKAEKDARDQARKKAEETAAAAVTINNQVAGEDDPNKPGSTAWKNAQALRTQGTRDVTAQETRFAEDVEQFNKDSEQLTRFRTGTDPASLQKARQAMADMAAMVNDAMDAMRILADDHQNVRNLASEVATLRQQIQSAAQYTLSQ